MHSFGTAKKEKSNDDDDQKLEEETNGTNKFGLCCAVLEVILNKLANYQL